MSLPSVTQARRKCRHQETTTWHDLQIDLVLLNLFLLHLQHVFSSFNNNHFVHYQHGHLLTDIFLLPVNLESLRNLLILKGTSHIPTSRKNIILSSFSPPLVHTVPSQEHSLEVLFDEDSGNISHPKALKPQNIKISETSPNCFLLWKQKACNQVAYRRKKSVSIHGSDSLEIQEHGTCSLCFNSQKT